MGWEHNIAKVSKVQTTTLSWDFDQVYGASTASNKVRLRNIFIRGVYWVSQTTEANTQYGTMGLGILRFPDTVSTPDPDWNPNAFGNGIDAQILNPRTILAAGENNPVLFSYSYKALNCRPGQKVLIGSYVLDESGNSINHYLNMTVSYWISDE